MTELMTDQPADADLAVPPTPPIDQTDARRAADMALRRRMKRQAMAMLLVAVLVLMAALSVPFVLRYLQITIP